MLNGSLKPIAHETKKGYLKKHRQSTAAYVSQIFLFLFCFINEMALYCADSFKTKNPPILLYFIFFQNCRRSCGPCLFCLLVKFQLLKKFHKNQFDYTVKLAIYLFLMLQLVMQSKLCATIILDLSSGENLLEKTIYDANPIMLLIKEKIFKFQLSTKSETQAVVPFFICSYFIAVFLLQSSFIFDVLIYLSVFS